MVWKTIHNVKLIFCMYCMVHLFYTFCGYLFIKKKFLIVYKFVHLIFKIQYLREKLDWCLILHLHRHFQVIKEAISHGACMDPPTNLAFMTLIWGLKYHRTSFASAYGNGAIHIILLRTKMLQSPLHPFLLFFTIFTKQD